MQLLTFMFGLGMQGLGFMVAQCLGSNMTSFPTVSEFTFPSFGMRAPHCSTGAGGRVGEILYGYIWESDKDYYA